MFRGKLKFVLVFLLLVVMGIGGYVFYLYQQGGREHYRPPVQKADSPQAQMLADMTVLSQAVEAYWAKNLKYPDQLEQLQPEFVEKIPLEAGSNKPFIYETDGTDRYRITVSDPSRYRLKEVFIENGELTQK